MSLVLGISATGKLRGFNSILSQHLAWTENVFLIPGNFWLFLNALCPPKTHTNSTQGFINTWSSLYLNPYSFVPDIYIYIWGQRLYMYSPPAAAITTPGVLPFESRGNWNRLQSPGSPQVSWNIIHKEFCEQSGLREVTGNWSRLHCSRQEEDQFSSAAQSCLTPWTAACQASLSITNSWSLIKLMSIESVDAIQPSHPLSSPSPLTFNLSQCQGLLKWVSSLHQVAKVLEFQLQNQSF